MESRAYPGALHTGLFEESWRDDLLARYKGVWVQQSSANYGNEDDGEPSAEDLTTVSYHCSPGHSSQIGHDLSYSYSVGTEVVLVREHCGIKILRSMGLVGSA